MIRLFSKISTFVELSVPKRKFQSTMGIHTFNNVSHVIFDMDGLLLNTEYIYEDVVREIAKSFGKEYPLSVRIKIMGTTDQMTGKIAVEELGLPISIPEFLKTHANMCKKRFTKLDLMPGAERIVRHLHKHNVPIALATSSGKEMAELKMSNYPELFKLFDNKVFGSTDSEVINGKPAPDIFLVAAKRFSDQPHPSRCLVFEDAPNGVIAAKSAGMQVVMVADKIVTESQRKEATIVLNSLDEFQPELFGLPSFIEIEI